ARFGFFGFGCALSYAAFLRAASAAFAAAAARARSEFNWLASSAPCGTRHDVSCAGAAWAGTTHCGGLVDGGGGTTRLLRSADCLISENTGAPARPPETSSGLSRITMAEMRGASAGAYPTNDAMCSVEEYPLASGLREVP